MKLKGLYTSKRSAMLHPIRTMEFIIVPMLFKSLRTAEELSCAALIKGIENTGKKTSYFDVKLRPVDAVFSLAAITVLTASMYAKLFWMRAARMINLNDVSYQYNGAAVQVIQNLSLSIKKGELVVITGKSGCGKTEFKLSVWNSAAQLKRRVCHATNVALLICAFLFHCESAAIKQPQKFILSSAV